MGTIARVLYQRRKSPETSKPTGRRPVVRHPQDRRTFAPKLKYTLSPPHIALFRRVW